MLIVILLSNKDGEIMSKRPQEEIILKNKILEAVIPLFNENGLKFKMDDLATSLSMSKKTIYSVFPTKKSLLYEMVDYVFDLIHQNKEEIIFDNKIDTKEKLRKLLCSLGEKFENIDLSKLYELKDKYPGVYKKVAMRLETGWESTFKLMEENIKDGYFRNFNLHVFKLMMEVTLEQFFQKDFLLKNGLTYKEALDQVVDILLGGITA